MAAGGVDSSCQVSSNPPDSWIANHYGGEFRESMQHESRMEVSWCEDVARV